MTDTQTEPMARLALRDHGSIDCLSVDLLQPGVIIVDMDGDTLFYPWHRVSGIGFYDDTALKPQVTLTDPDDFSIPTRHEGSE